MTPPNTSTPFRTSETNKSATQTWRRSEVLRRYQTENSRNRSLELHVLERTQLHRPQHYASRPTLHGDRSGIDPRDRHGLG
jgi:hypothetical protein